MCLILALVGFKDMFKVRHILKMLCRIWMEAISCLPELKLKLSICLSILLNTDGVLNCIPVITQKCQYVLNPEIITLQIKSEDMHIHNQCMAE